MRATETTLRRVAFDVLAVTLSTVFALALTEGLFRVIGFPFDEQSARSGTPLARFDPELGWDYVPGLTTILDFPDPQRATVLRSIPLSFDLDLGARVASADVRIDPAAPSVVFVGCSFTMGHGVTWDESFVGRVAAALPALQILNLGVQGYGTDQALLRLRRHAGRFGDLRAVVYGFIPRHVYRNAYADRRLLVRSTHFAGTTPRFVLRDDAATVLAERPVRSADAGAYSRVVAAVRVAWARYGPIPSLALTRALVSEMRREAEAHGARFFVLEWDPLGEEARWRADGGSLFEGSDVQTLRTDTGAPPHFAQQLIPDDGHPTPEAHAHVASLLVAALRDLAPPDDPRLREGAGRSGRTAIPPTADGSRRTHSSHGAQRPLGDGPRHAPSASAPRCRAPHHGRSQSAPYSAAIKAKPRVSPAVPGAILFMT